MPDLPSPPGLRDQLDRWVAAALIDAGQAERIAAAEAERTGEADAEPVRAAGVGQTAPAAGERLPLAVEAIGYVGGILAIVAGYTSVTVLWPGIPASAELALAAIAAVALGVAAAVMRVRDEPAFHRLRSVLWFLSTASAAAFMGVFGGQVLRLSEVSSLLLTAVVTAACAVLAWWRNPSPLQHLAAFAAVAVVAGSGVARFAPGLHAWGPGLAVWVLSAAWGIAVYRGYLRPAGAGYLAAGAGLLVGAMMTMQEGAGHVFAAATLVALLAAGVGLRRVWLVAIGAIGVIAVVPATVSRYLPQSAAVPLAIFVVGLALVGLALGLAKGRRTSRTGQSPSG